MATKPLKYSSIIIHHLTSNWRVWVFLKSVSDQPYTRNEGLCWIYRIDNNGNTERKKYRPPLIFTIICILYLKLLHKNSNKSCREILVPLIKTWCRKGNFKFLSSKCHYFPIKLASCISNGHVCKTIYCNIFRPEYAWNICHLMLDCKKQSQYD